MRCGGSNATWPLAELLVDDTGICLRLRGAAVRRLLSRWFPVISVRWDEITMIERIRGGILIPGNVGLRITTSAETSGEAPEIIFWCFPATRDRAVELLTQSGVPISDGGTIW